MTSRGSGYRRFPIRIFIGAVVVVCLALAVSALLGYRSMIQLRDLYLEDRARDVSELLTERLRGPDRLEAEAWHQLMEEVLQSGAAPGLRYLALLDDRGDVLTASGKMSDNLHLHEAEVRTPRWGRQGGRFGRPGGGAGAGGGTWPGQ